MNKKSELKETNKALLELANMYLADIEQRIVCLKGELTNDMIAWNDPEEYDDIEQQVKHWETTKEYVEKVINAVEDNK